MLGASAVKALTIARAELTLFGVLAMDDAEAPTELKVCVLTNAEHTKIKRRVELPDDYKD